MTSQRFPSRSPLRLLKQPNVQRGYPGTLAYERTRLHVAGPDVHTECTRKQRSHAVLINRPYATRLSKVHAYTL